MTQLLGVCNSKPCELAHTRGSMGIFSRISGHGNYCRSSQYTFSILARVPHLPLFTAYLDKGNSHGFLIKLNGLLSPIFHHLTEPFCLFAFLDVDKC